MNDKYLSLKEVAHLTKKSYFTVRKWVREGMIPAEKFPIGSIRAHWYIRELDIPTFLKK